MRIDLEIGPILRALTRQKTAFALVVAEVALSFAVISTMIWVGSWYRERGNPEPGFATSDLVSVVSVGRAEPLEAAEARRQQELQMLAHLPQVHSASAISSDLLENKWSTSVPVWKASAGAGVADSLQAWLIDGSPGLFSTLGLTLQTGRLPKPGAIDEVLMSAGLAEALHGSAEAIGNAVKTSLTGPPLKVVGTYSTVNLVIPFLINSQWSILRIAPAGDERGTRYLVRSLPGQRAEVISLISKHVQALDQGRTLEVAPFDLHNARHVVLADALLMTLGIIALALGVVALLGTLAITAFLVQQRTRQVGIRRALGATPWDIVHQFLIENGLAVLLGCISGLAISLAYYFVFGHLFLAVRLSPKFFVFTAALLFLDGALATLVPALRAARIPPTVASRSL